MRFAQWGFEQFNNEKVKSNVERQKLERKDFLPAIEAVAHRPPLLFDSRSG